MEHALFLVKWERRSRQEGRRKNMVFVIIVA